MALNSHGSVSASPRRDASTVHFYPYNHIPIGRQMLFMKSNTLFSAYDPGLID